MQMSTKETNALAKVFVRSIVKNWLM